MPWPGLQRLTSRCACHAAWLARFGSGVFMIVQMIILVDMAQSWNDSWVNKDDHR